MTVSNRSDPRFPLPAELLELSLAEMAERLEAMPEDASLRALKSRVDVLRDELERIGARADGPVSSSRITAFVNDVLATEAEIGRLWIDEGRPAFTTTLWRARSRGETPLAS